MNEPAEVEARFATDGQIRVIRFSWRGSKLQVTSPGRSWGADDGLHYLVMTPGDRIFELLYEPVKGLWSVVRTGQDLFAGGLHG